MAPKFLLEWELSSARKIFKYITGRGVVWSNNIRFKVRGEAKKKEREWFINSSELEGNPSHLHPEG